MVVDNSSVKYTSIGKRPIRHDGYDKVTGKAQFGADIYPSNLIYAKVLRSPHAHAKIISINTKKALEYPGVKAVITSKDFPIHSKNPEVLGSGPPINIYNLGTNILARDKVLYKGHAIAAIAANNIHTAEEALSLIEIKYELIQSVTNVEDAMASNAPIIHPEYPGNVASQDKLNIGDIDEGFNKADIIIEKEFRTSTVHQGYIELHSATALWQPNNHVTLWTSSQGHFQIRDRTAAILGIEPSSIKSVPMEIGGGFGGKTTIYLEPISAMLSKMTGQPVKTTMNRAEVLEASGPTSGSYMKIKMGSTNQGKLVAAEAKLVFEAGAFPGSPIGGASQCIFSPYDIENVLVDGYDIIDNKPKTTAYRAPGAPIGAFGVETVVDELCTNLKIPPLDFRIMNAAKEGTRRANGILNPPIGMIETVEAIKSHQHNLTPLNGKNTGRGVASGFWMNGTGPACAIANVNFDGSVSLTIGSMDIGGTRPGAAQQFAEVLGIPVETVNPQVGDTDSIGYTSMTGGSGAAFKTGWASFEAAEDVRRQMIERAALIWEKPIEEIGLKNGLFCHKSDSKLQVSFKELASKLGETGGPVVGKANLDPSGAGGAFATHIVDLEVDIETGKIKILRYTAAQDVGKAIHPSYVEGQIQGGVVQGIGWALNEEYFMNDKGALMNSSLLDYRMPTSLDLPNIDTIIVEVPNPTHPYGVRGVGEVPIVPPMAAIANAIHDAIGIRMHQLPMNPAIVLKEMKKIN
ncbi:MAG: xanthine dehydrogenase family protein molybdopterin-binding subunit [Dehalococcoidia bacterium]